MHSANRIFNHGGKTALSGLAVDISMREGPASGISEAFTFMWYDEGTSLTKPNAILSLEVSCSKGLQLAYGRMSDAENFSLADVKAAICSSDVATNFQTSNSSRKKKTRSEL